MSINKVTISGNLTRDPELRTTAGGMSVLTMGVAVNDRQKNQQTGEWEDYPNFVDCTMFGSRAEGVSRYLSKGSKVAIAGKLRYSSWERDGQRRSKLEVVVDDLEFMSRGEGQAQPAAYGAPQQPARPQARQRPDYRQGATAPSADQAQRLAQASYAQQPQYVEATVYDEDIPF